MALIVKEEDGQEGKSIDAQALGLEKDATKEDIQEMINELTLKLKQLHQKEEEFNKSAALVPESDPNITLINDKIQHIKDQVDRLSQERA